MPLDFPTSPTNGQTYNGYVYSTSVGAWQAKPAAQSPFYTSDTPPSNPVAGDSWFNTNDGTMYIYVNDGNTSQWVEHRSEIARSQVGLVPLKPTSISVGAGTASVNTSGQISFTSIPNLRIDNIFSSNYKNYRVVFECVKNTTSANDFVLYRFGTNGSVTATATFSQGAVAFATSNGALQNLGGNSAYDLMMCRVYGSGGRNSASIDISNPNEALYTTATGTWVGTTLSDGQHGVASGIWNSTNQFTDLYIWVTGNTMTGTVKVYGYN